jgi:hypothetical protein
MPRRSPLLAGIVAMTAFLGCHLEEPFVRDNHWDPDASVTKRLVAPESTFSIGDRITVELVADPPLPAGPLNIEWTSNGVADTAIQVFAAGAGEFVVARANAGYRPVAVSARLDDVLVSTTVMVGQKVASLALGCGSAGAPVACDATPLAVNALRTVSSTMADANTNAIRRREFVMQRATTVSRDPSVLSTAPTIANAAGQWTVRGIAPGSTWLVVTVDGRRDSVRFVVTP